MQYEDSDQQARTIIAGGAVFAAVAGAAGLVLPVLGLVGVLPMSMAIAATIAMGVGLLIEGSTLTSQYHALRRRTGTADEVELAGGMTADVLGGLAAVTLGVLALIGASPITVLGIATIVLGASLMIGSAAIAQLDHLPDGWHRAIVPVASGAASIIGLGAVVLGVLVTAGMSPEASMQVLLIALLVVGAALLATGAAASLRLMVFQRAWRATRS
jgi:hypothetical protein